MWKEPLTRREIQAAIIAFVSALTVGLARNMQNAVLEGLAIVGVPILLTFLFAPKKDLRLSCQSIEMATIILIDILAGTMLLILGLSEKNNVLYWLGVIVACAPWVLIALTKQQKPMQEQAQHPNI